MVVVDGGTAPVTRRAVEHAVGRGREFVGLVWGVGVSALTLVWVAASALVLLGALVSPRFRPRARGRIEDWASRLCERDLSRLSHWMGATITPEAGVPSRAVHLLLRLPVHLCSLYVLLSVASLVPILVGGALIQAATGTATHVSADWPGVGVGVSSVPLGLMAALVVLVVTWWLVRLLAGVERWLARSILGPTEEDLMRRRIQELTRTRSGIVRAVDQERRRIERDLHDGVQQRVVALAMLLGRAQRGRDPERAAELVRQAHTESRVLLDELREVAWRIYPTALDTLGLEAALTEAAERGPLPVVVRADLPRPLPQELATAVYFVAREAMTNAAKHSGADSVVVDLGVYDSRVWLTVSDDGRGGADPGGDGLTGLARRVRALDGTLEVRSPRGGPTTVHAVLPLAR
ncbi:sensor histidine kinase [Nocardiopsis sp. NPDC006938]|uniref:sensor histidine kinase n=1 Tax=Nocardiopsis sp. NPDC006938 TaxID=3364337 RepID=UPI0036C6A7B0